MAAEQGQLPTSLQLVTLPAVLDSLVEQAHTGLQQLASTLPGLQDEERWAHRPLASWGWPAAPRLQTWEGLQGLQAWSPASASRVGLGVAGGPGSRRRRRSTAPASCARPTTPGLPPPVLLRPALRPAARSCAQEARAAALPARQPAAAAAVARGGGVVQQGQGGGRGEAAAGGGSHPWPHAHRDG